MSVLELVRPDLRDFAGYASARRAKGMPDAFRISAWAIACGAGSTIALMTSLGVIDTAITTLIPIGSMLIANAMNTNGLALNRFRSDVLAHVGEIEAALANARAAANDVIAGFAGSTADALTLFEKFEGKLQEFNGNLRRAAVEHRPLAPAPPATRLMRSAKSLISCSSCWFWMSLGSLAKTSRS